MQASKIIPKKTYAVRARTPEGTLCRFYVEEVQTITRRKHMNRSPHDSVSKVVGRYVDEDNSEGKANATLEPESILGPYQDYQELVERQQKERAERERLEKEKQDRAARLATLLYKAVGQKAPKELGSWDNVFRTSYAGVNIKGDYETMTALIKFFEAHVSKPA